MSSEVPLDVVGLKEIARRLNVRPQTAAQWNYRKLLPDPEGYVSGSPCWRWTRIETWARDTGRIGAVGPPGAMTKAQIDALRFLKIHEGLRGHRGYQEEKLGDAARQVLEAFGL